MPEAFVLETLRTGPLAGRVAVVSGGGRGVMTVLASEGCRLNGEYIVTGGLVVVISPIYMTNMLVRHTGKKLLEKHMARSKGAAYADYVRRTSGFVPWPPR